MKNGSQVTVGAQDAYDLNPVFSHSVEDGVATDGEAPKPRGKFFPAAPQLGRFGENRTLF